MGAKSNPANEALAVAVGRSSAAGEPQIATPAASVRRIAPPGRFWALNLKELAEYRELLYFLVWREIKVRYKQTLIGAGWALVQPVATMIVFTLFFGRLARIPSGGVPYPLFFYAALLPWTYFAGALAGATNSMVENQRVITKVYFPRVLLPLSAVFTGLVDFGIAFVLLAGLALYYHVAPGPWLAFLPVFLLLAMLTAFGAGLWLAALNALYRDVRYVVPFLIQFWLFASPVAYPSSLVPGRWRALYGLNPMAGVIDGFRWAMTGRNPPSLGLVSASAAAVIVLLVAGLWFFRRVEATVADVV